MPFLGRIHTSLLAALLLLLPVLVVAGSLEFFENSARDFDYASQVELPATFGEAEFTFEIWVRLDDSLPVGPTLGGQDQLRNWSDSDETPYSSIDWWFHGNFLLDGHNNSNFEDGTFSLQVYGGGRIRWLFGDGIRQTGGPWAIQASSTSATPSLLDGQWHQITLVRRWSGSSNASLELWIDGAQVATETSTARTNMAIRFWNGWSGYPNNEQGWIYAAEKGTVVGTLSQWEDYKGLIDEIRFWNRAKTASEITMDYAANVVGNEPGLLGVYRFGEDQGNVSCDSMDPGRCIFLTNTQANVWSSVEAPIGGSSDSSPPSIPDGLQGDPLSDSRIDLAWNASSDNVGVTGYDVRRDGALIATVTQTSLSDTGLTASTSYVYTVAARDAAGNVSAESPSIVITTQSTPDTSAPTVPTNLQGNAASPTEIDISWSPSTDNVGVTNYEIFRDGISIGTTAQTQYHDSNLSANTSYSYTVLARDAAGNSSAQSSGVSVTTQSSTDVDAPSAPTDLQGDALSMSSIRISWTASTDNIAVTGYDILRDGTVVTSTSNTSFTDSGLNSSTTYTYTVVAKDAAGNRSAESSSVGVTTRSDTVIRNSGGGGGAVGLDILALLLVALCITRRHSLGGRSNTVLWRHR